MKKIKKFYPLIVGLVLLISVAAYGTRAFFSDSTKEDAGIELTLGDVEITPKGKEWKYITNTETKNTVLKNNGDTNFDPSNMGTNIEITDARPGDSFSKEFEFENTGSLVQSVTFVTTKDAPNIFEVTWENIDSTNKFNESTPVTLEPKDTVTLRMTVSVILNTDAEQHGTSANNKTKSKEWNQLVEQSIAVTAVQTNK